MSLTFLHGHIDVVEAVSMRDSTEASGPVVLANVTMGNFTVEAQAYSEWYRSQKS